MDPSAREVIALEPSDEELQQMAELYLLGLEIFLVVRIRGRANWHLLDHLETITF